jgi:hypothetical protein
MARYLKLGPYLSTDASVLIAADFGKHGLQLKVSCDDWPCLEEKCTRDEEIRKIVDLLNRHWDDPLPMTTSDTCATNARLATDRLKSE